MRYLSHARPVVRDLSSVCPTVRLPTLSHPTKGRRLGLPQLHRILLLLLRRLRALRPGLPRPPRPQVSQRPQGLLQEGHRSPVEHVLGTSRVMWLRGSRDVVDHGCPAALRQASCRHGSGGRGAETIYSNNGPRVIREALDFPIFKNASRAFSPLQTCARATPGERRRMRVRLPSSTIEDGLPSPSKSKPARASLLHRLLNKHIILLLMLALTVRRSSHTCKCAPS